MRKILIIFSICIIAILSFVSISINKLIKVEKAVYLDEKGSITAFSGRLFGIGVNGIINKNHISGTKLLGFSYKSSENPFLLNNNGDKLYLSIGSQYMVLYNREGKKLGNWYLVNRNIISVCLSDMNHDGSDEIIFLSALNSSEYADNMEILEVERVGEVKNLKNVYKLDCTYLKPWKVQTSDVDGDGKKEISLGVYKTTEFHPERAKRPFIYNWDGRQMSPKWLGSRLSRPFEDYIFADIDGDGMDEIVAIELLENGQKCLASYKWKGFGFEKHAESSFYKQIYTIDKNLGINGGSYGIKADFEGSNGRADGVFYCTEKRLVLKE